MATPFYDAWQAAVKAKDVDAMSALMTDDFTMVMHSSGKSLSKEFVLSYYKGKFSKPEAPMEKQRCVAEAANVCVSHSFNKFPNGTVDAIMYVQHLKDGKCFRTETGSTSVPEDSPNFIK